MAKGAIAPPLMVENWKFCYIYTEFNVQITETRHFLVKLQNLKLNLQEMYFLGLESSFFQNFALATLGISSLTPPLKNI